MGCGPEGAGEGESRGWGGVGEGRLRASEAPIGGREVALSE